MGIDIVTFQAILKSFKYINKKDSILTLGRQQFHLYYHDIQCFLQEYSMFPLESNIHNYINPNYCETFFHDIGFKKVLSLDNSDYEKANIIFNFNLPVKVSEEQKFDYIFDGGSTEHIFNQLQVCQNIINLLNVGGVFCSVTCNNNFSGHGLYQFSPEYFLSVYNEKYGMQILELYLAEADKDSIEWINVNSYNGYRNMSKIDTKNYVYIVAIVKKIEEKGENILFENPPNQFSYEEIEWKKNSL